VGDDNAPPDVASQRTKLWELPDTSILFWRYLEAGRMINAYDWYESFKQILDVQREQATTAEHATPKKNRGSAEEVATDEEDEEKWGMEIQARFMRALHELDFLGFIKHTGRKADHVIRTTYDLE
jgi:origin recognition complex subunit 3